MLASACHKNWFNVHSLISGLCRLSVTIFDHIHIFVNSNSEIEQAYYDDSKLVDIFKIDIREPFKTTTFGSFPTTPDRNAFLPQKFTKSYHSGGCHGLKNDPIFNLKVPKWPQDNPK